MQYLFPHFQYAAAITAIIASILIGFISYGLVFRTSLFDFLIDKPFLVPFLTMPATMFALLMAFMASSVWQNTSLARTSLWNERLAIESISRLPIEPEALKIKISRDLLRYVDVVIHEAWLKISEEGTEAAAATGVAMGETSAMMDYVYLNRPFLFAIEDNKSGSILFMGKITDPSKL